jgi:hypothetical protein
MASLGGVCHCHTDSIRTGRWLNRACWLLPRYGFSSTKRCDPVTLPPSGALHRYVHRVADKDVEVSKTTTPAVGRPGNNLSTPSLVTAYALGIASLGAGGVAVFITHVEAGPVALLFVGLIFMIVALSGRLPTRLKLGENEAEWQRLQATLSRPRWTQRHQVPRLRLPHGLSNSQRLPHGLPQPHSRASRTKTVLCRSLQ